MKKIVINGQFFLQHNTGQQRYAKGILLELDKIIGKNEITIVVPKKAIDIPGYKNFKIINVGNINNRLWEQFDLGLYLVKEKKISLNLCNTTSLLKRGITVIHDISCIINKKHYNTLVGRLSRIYFSFNQSQAIKSGLPVITVSEYSKKSIVEHFNITPDLIIVIPDAWQHFEHIIPDDSIFSKYPDIEKGSYIFSLGSLLRQKNHDWIYTNAKYNPKEKYIIAGKKVKSYKYRYDVLPTNVHYLGFLTDGELKSLMTNCKAFLFPSLFEGFGLPPLEALSVGAPIIISDAASLPEVYEDSASYIDPYNPNIDINQKIKIITDQKRHQILSKYSFKKSAELLYDLLKQYEQSEK